MSGWIQAGVAFLLWIGSIVAVIYRFGKQKELYDGQIKQLIEKLGEERNLNKEQERKIAFITNLEERLKTEKELNHSQEAKLTILKEMQHTLKEHNHSNIVDFMKAIARVENHLGKMEVEVEHFKTDLIAIKQKVG